MMFGRKRVVESAEARGRAEAIASLWRVYRQALGTAANHAFDGQRQFDEARSDLAFAAAIRGEIELLTGTACTS